MLAQKAVQDAELLTWHCSEFQIFSESQQSRLSQNIGRYFHCIQLAPERVKWAKRNKNLIFAFKHRLLQLRISFPGRVPTQCSHPRWQPSRLRLLIHDVKVERQLWEAAGDELGRYPYLLPLM